MISESQKIQKVDELSPHATAMAMDEGTSNLFSSSSQLISLRLRSHHEPLWETENTESSFLSSSVSSVTYRTERKAGFPSKRVSTTTQGTRASTTLPRERGGKFSIHRGPCRVMQTATVYQSCVVILALWGFCTRQRRQRQASVTASGRSSSSSSSLSPSMVLAVLSGAETCASCSAGLELESPEDIALQSAIRHQRSQTEAAAPLDGVLPFERPPSVVRLEDKGESLALHAGNTACPLMSMLVRPTGSVEVLATLLSRLPLVVLLTAVHLLGCPSVVFHNFGFTAALVDRLHHVVLQHGSWCSAMAKGLCTWVIQHYSGTTEGAMGLGEPGKGHGDSSSLPVDPSLPSWVSSAMNVTERWITQQESEEAAPAKGEQQEEGKKVEKPTEKACRRAHVPSLLSLTFPELRHSDTPPQSPLSQCVHRGCCHEWFNDTFPRWLLQLSMEHHATLWAPARLRRRCWERWMTRKGLRVLAHLSEAWTPNPAGGQRSDRAASGLSAEKPTATSSSTPPTPALRSPTEPPGRGEDAAFSIQGLVTPDASTIVRGGIDRGASVSRSSHSQWSRGRERKQKKHKKANKKANAVSPSPSVSLGSTSPVLESSLASLSAGSRGAGGVGVGVTTHHHTRKLHQGGNPATTSTTRIQWQDSRETSLQVQAATPIEPPRPLSPLGTLSHAVPALQEERRARRKLQRKRREMACALANLNASRMQSLVWQQWQSWSATRREHLLRAVEAHGFRLRRSVFGTWCAKLHQRLLQAKQEAEEDIITAFTHRRTKTMVHGLCQQWRRAAMRRRFQREHQLYPLFQQWRTQWKWKLWSARQAALNIHSGSSGGGVVIVQASHDEQSQNAAASGAIMTTTGSMITINLPNLFAQWRTAHRMRRAERWYVAALRKRIALCVPRIAQRIHKLDDRLSMYRHYRLQCLWARWKRRAVWRGLLLECQQFQHHHAKRNVLSKWYERQKYRCAAKEQLQAAQEVLGGKQRMHVLRQCVARWQQKVTERHHINQLRQHRGVALFQHWRKRCQQRSRQRKAHEQSSEAFWAAKRYQQCFVQWRQKLEEAQAHKRNVHEQHLTDIAVQRHRVEVLASCFFRWRAREVCERGRKRSISLFLPSSRATAARLALGPFSMQQPQRKAFTTFIAGPPAPGMLHHSQTLARFWLQKEQNMVLKRAKAAPPLWAALPPHKGVIPSAEARGVTEAATPVRQTRAVRVDGKWSDRKLVSVEDHAYEATRGGVQPSMPLDTAPAAGDFASWVGPNVNGPSTPTHQRQHSDPHTHTTLTLEAQSQTRIASSAMAEGDGDLVSTPRDEKRDHDEGPDRGDDNAGITGRVLYLDPKDSHHRHSSPVAGQDRFNGGRESYPGYIAFARLRGEFLKERRHRLEPPPTDSTSAYLTKPLFYPRGYHRRVPLATHEDEGVEPITRHISNDDDPQAAVPSHWLDSPEKKALNSALSVHAIGLRDSGHQCKGH